MIEGVDRDERVFLSMLPAGRGERRLALAVVLLSLMAFAAAAPFARVQLARVDAFIPAYQAALIINDLITAVLLFGQFSILRLPGLRLLAGGYLFTALMVVVHTLSFPGLFSPSGLLGAGPQTTAWLYMFWHGGFPLFVLGYAWFGKAGSAAAGLPDRVGTAILSSVAGVVAAVIALTLLVTTWQGFLPAIMDGNHYTPIMIAVVSAVWLLSLAALIVLSMRRPYSVLDLWLIVVMCAWLFDVALSAVLNAGRFDLGFYAGRIYGLLAASFVLMVLLLETRTLYSRLARSLEAERLAAHSRAQELQEANQKLRLSEDRLHHLNKELEQRYGHVVDLVREAIWIHVDGTIVFANPAAANMLGAASPSELVGRPAMSLIDPADRDRAVERTRRMIQEQRPLEVAEMRLARLDGGTATAELQAVPFMQDGKLHVLAAGHDVTGQREAETKLHQAQKMEAVGQLTGGIAHDFNNLLAVIIGNLQLLEKPLQENERLYGRVKLGLEAARSGAELTRRLLAFARRQRLEPKLIQVNDLLLQMLPLMERTLGEAIRISVRVADDPWPTNVDPSQLESAILNLAINARDAMPNGGDISIITENVTLDGNYTATHPYSSPGRYVMIAVTDSGTGMTPEVVKRAFEPFFTTKEAGHGTGLGLSMVYGFVKQSGGQVELYSEPGHGTSVKIYLPEAADGAVMRSDMAAAADEAPEGSERILVVDDNARVRATAVSILESLGYEVLEAGNGPEALAALAKNGTIDLVFSDIVMPGGMTGFALAEEVARHYPQARTLLTSGFADIGSGPANSALGNRSWIGKPYEREALARKIREVLNASRQA